ncbi:MAG TPA: hypothetical protein VF041_12545 [Gemmatimonadaceae bacterium]
MSDLRKSWRPLALFAGAVLIIAGCQENLGGGAACATLCPDTLSLKDTVLVASEVLDTDATVSLPPLGTESQILLADYQQGSQTPLPVRTVGVLRFDSLLRVVPDSDTTAAPRYFDRVDSAGVVVNVTTPDSTKAAQFVKDTVTFLVYDVDVDAPDFDTAAVRERFSTPPIASRVVPPDSIFGKSIRIDLDSGFVGRHVRDGTRIRLGIAVQSKQGVQVRITSSEGGSSASLRYFGFHDTTRVFEIVPVNTEASVGPPIPSLADYTLVLAGTPPPPDGVLAAGGIPSSRIFLRFALPPALVDSSTTIVRANLELHQLGNSAFSSTDSMFLSTRVVRAKPGLTDVAKASLLATDPSSLGIRVPAITAAPTLTRVDTIPLVGLLLAWKAEGAAASQRAIVLQASGETLDPRQYYIYSSAATPDSLRPRLHISYIPKSGFGLP